MYCMMSTFATDDKIEEEVESRLDAIDESEYDDMLDECTPMIVIGTLEYSPSQVLKAVAVSYTHLTLPTIRLV